MQEGGVIRSDAVRHPLERLHAGDARRPARARARGEPALASVADCAARSAPLGTRKRIGTTSLQSSFPRGDDDTMRAFNFSPGPAVLPEPVLRQAAAEMTDYRGSGMSVMEMSHRGKEFIAIHAKAEADLRALLAIPSNHKVLFLQGGAIAENAIVPMNLMGGFAAPTTSTPASGRRSRSRRRRNTGR
jgi:hypothetical protein